MTVIVDDAAPVLRELAQEANAEHRAALNAAADAVQHAIASGRVLLRIREQVPAGRWEEWVYKYFDAPTMAGPYMRLAKYSHLLPAGVKLTQLEALQHLKGLPGTSGNRSSAEVLKLRPECERLRTAGYSQREVADILGIAKSMIYRWERGSSIAPAPSGRPREEGRAARQAAVAAEKAARVVAASPEARTAAWAERGRKHGEPGKQALGFAVRHVAQAKGRDDTREALLDLAAICEAWANRLGGVTKANDDA